MRYILASKSPRRQELLVRTGLSFEVIPSDMEEIITKVIPSDIVMELAEQKAKHVYAFDIQAQAIENTKEKVKEYTNVTCILDSHVKVKDYIQETLDFAIFNFGYLPKGDKTITTMKETSLQAVQNVLDILHPQGILCLCFYPGHEEGAKEKDYVLDYLLKQEQLLLSHYHTLQPFAPELYLISKRKEKQL